MSARAFSKADRDAVWQKLLDSAEAEFSQHGYRKANISEIARHTGIAKGTVYRFVASKAELFIQAIQRIEVLMREELRQEMSKAFPSPQEQLSHFLKVHYEALDQPLLSVMVDPEEAAALMRDLPPESMEELRLDDERFYSELAEEWRSGGLVDIDPQVLAALPRALFSMALQRDMIGRDVFPRVMDIVIQSLSRTLATK